MILEKALVNYNVKGEYENTLESEFIEFENMEQIKDYINKNIIKDVEYFIYNNEEDVENNECIESIVCNDILKEI